MWWYILFGLAALVGLFLVVVAMQPSVFRVTRSIQVAATPESTFAQVNHLRSWENWSPWAKLDPNAQMTYDGPPEGVGASYHWDGNKQVGEGRSTITESRPSDLVRLKLEFIKPFACVNDVEFTFQPRGPQTLVNWSMTGKNNFMGKAFCLLMNMDKMIGKDFEKGLASLKGLVESSTKA